MIIKNQLFLVYWIIIRYTNRTFWFLWSILFYYSIKKKTFSLVLVQSKNWKLIIEFDSLFNTSAEICYFNLVMEAFLSLLLFFYFFFFCQHLGIPTFTVYACPHSPRYRLKSEVASLTGLGDHTIRSATNSQRLGVAHQPLTNNDYRRMPIRGLEHSTSCKAAQGQVIRAISRVLFSFSFILLSKISSFKFQILPPHPLLIGEERGYTPYFLLFLFNFFS